MECLKLFRRNEMRREGEDVCRDHPVRTRYYPNTGTSTEVLHRYVQSNQANTSEYWVINLVREGSTTNVHIPPLVCVVGPIVKATLFLLLQMGRQWSRHNIDLNHRSVLDIWIWLLCVSAYWASSCPSPERLLMRPKVRQSEENERGKKKQTYGSGRGVALSS